MKEIRNEQSRAALFLAGSQWLGPRMLTQPSTSSLRPPHRRQQRWAPVSFVSFDTSAWDPSAFASFKASALDLSSRRVGLLCGGLARCVVDWLAVWSIGPLRRRFARCVVDWPTGSSIRSPCDLLARCFVDSLAVCRVPRRVVDSFAASSIGLPCHRFARSVVIGPYIAGRVVVGVSRWR